MWRFRYTPTVPDPRPFKVEFDKIDRVSVDGAYELTYYCYGGEKPTMDIPITLWLFRDNA